MKNNNIIPTVFSHDKKEFLKRFNRLIKVSEKIQIDFMDGKFVPAKSITMKEIPSLKKYKIEFEAHLMVKNPKPWIKEAKQKGFKRVIFHLEAVKTSEIGDLISLSKKLNLEVYLAINPNTKLKILLKILNKIKIKPKGILFLGVHPGKEGQKFQKIILRRIKKLKSKYPKIITQIDGGVNENTIKKIVKYPVDFINSGSFVSNSKNPKSQIIFLEDFFQKKLIKKV